MTDDLTPTVENLPTSEPAPAVSPVIRWGLWDVIVGIALFFLALSVTIGVVAIARVDLTDEDVVGAFSFGSSLLGYAALVTALVLASRKGHRSFAKDFGLRFRPADIGLGLAAGVLAKIVTIVVTALAISGTGSTPEQGNFVLSNVPVWVVLNGVLIVSIIAPVVEELFFRGLVLRSVQNRVLRRGGSEVRAAVAALLVSSVAFAALHLYQSTDLTLLIILGGGTLTLGLANSVIALTTGRLGGPIIAHVFYNGSSIAVALIAAYAS